MKCRRGEEDGTAGVGAADDNRKEVNHMPGFDRTGPMGAGPMTGGGWGFCNPYARVYGGRGFGRGRGRGRGYNVGFGRGRGLGWRGVYPRYGSGYQTAYADPYAMSPEEETQMLKNDAEAIKRELDAINRRIGELEAQSPES